MKKKTKAISILLTGVALAIGIAVSNGIIQNSFHLDEAKAVSEITWTHTSTNSTSTFPIKGSNTKNNVTYNLQFENNSATVGNWNTSYAGVQMGSSSQKTKLSTFTFQNPWGGTGTYKDYTKITKITFIGNSGEDSGTSVAATIGGQPTSSSVSKFSKSTSGNLTTVEFTPTANYDSGIIIVTANATTAAWYFKSISITAIIPTASRTLTGINVSGTPLKTSYFAGESFDSNGVTVTASFSDSADDNVTSLCSYTPNPLTAGTTSVLVSFTEGTVTKTASILGITVTEPEYVEITKTFEGYANEISNGSIDSSWDWAGVNGATVTRTWDSAIRVYANSEFRIVPASGNTNKSLIMVEFEIHPTSGGTPTYEMFTGTNDSTWTSVKTGTIIEGGKISYTGTGGFKYFSLKDTGSAQLHFINVKIRYMSDSLPVSEDAVAYGTSFLSATADGCSTANSSTLSGVWASLESSYNALSNDAKAYLTGLTPNVSGNDAEHAVARYIHIITKYGEATFNDFMNLDLQSAPSSSDVLALDSHDFLPLIAVISVVGLTILIGYYYHNKRKEA